MIETLPQSGPERGRAFGVSPVFAAGMAVLLMVLIGHGCHGPDADLEPSAVPVRIDGPGAG